MVLSGGTGCQEGLCCQVVFAGFRSVLLPQMSANNVCGMKRVSIEPSSLSEPYSAHDATCPGPCRRVCGAVPDLLSQLCYLAALSFICCGLYDL